MGAIERVRAVRAGRENVGGTERFLRGTVGPTLIVVGAAGLAGLVTLASGTLGTALSVVAVLAGARMSQTAITKRCYVNALLGRDSRRTADADGSPGSAEAVDRG